MLSYHPGLKSVVLSTMVGFMGTKSGRDWVAKIIYEYIINGFLRSLPLSFRCKIIYYILKLPVKYSRVVLAETTKPWGAQKDYLTKIEISKEVHGYWVAYNRHQNKKRWVEKTAKNADMVMYFIHGGGFRTGQSTMYMESYIHIIEYLKRKRNMNVRVFTVDYRRLPETNYYQTKEDCMTGYRYLVQDLGIDPKKIVFAGDSAGGNLVASCILTLRDMNSPVLPQPAANVLISPWVDISVNTVVEKEHVDCLNFKMLKSDSGDYFINTGMYRDPVEMKKALRNPALSPLYASFSGVCPSLITYGGTEVLQYQIRDMIAAMKRDNAPHDVIFRSNAPHIWIICSMLSPSHALWKKDISAMADWCADHV
ncbi:Alpha/Beta hydrolase protein [Pilobolus umbonatus]|nr:Alpha/Beta hydrolase protein [Pilobolus umbonatus]